MTTTNNMLSIPVRARFVSDEEIGQLLERVEEVKRTYKPKDGWLGEENRYFVGVEENANAR